MSSLPESRPRSIEARGVSFCIARWPTTVAEYRRFMEEGGAYVLERWWEPEGWRWRQEEGLTAPGQWERQLGRAGNHPVTGVSWWEAAAYCRWLSTVLPRRFEGWEAALPTEAQWEMTARGGEALPDGRDNPDPRREYPWEGAWDANNANCERRVGTTTPVGVFPAGHGPLDTWDTAGNVWEWCLDWFHEDAYAREPGPDPGLDGEELASGHRVVRGGSWGDDAGGLRAAARSRDGPASRGDILGFRVVLRPCLAP